MRYLKLYENFIEELEVDEVDQLQDEEETKPYEVELSDTTIDDILKFDKGSYVDSKGVVHIKNWNFY